MTSWSICGRCGRSRASSFSRIWPPAAQWCSAAGSSRRAWWLCCEQHRAAATSMVPTHLVRVLRECQPSALRALDGAARHRYGRGLGAAGDFRAGARCLRPEDRRALWPHRSILELLSAAVSARRAAGNPRIAHDVRRPPAVRLRSHDCRRSRTGAARRAGRDFDPRRACHAGLLETARSDRPGAQG